MSKDKLSKKEYDELIRNAIERLDYGSRKDLDTLYIYIAVSIIGIAFLILSAIGFDFKISPDEFHFNIHWENLKLIPEIWNKLWN